MLLDEVIAMLPLMPRRMINAPLIFLRDGTNKNACNVIIMISFWCIYRVVAFLLDSNDTIGDNVNTSDAFKILWKKSMFVMEMVQLKQRWGDYALILVEEELDKACHLKWEN